MNEYELIEKRYGFALPPVYRRLESQGQFASRGDQGQSLCFYDCDWLPLEGIANYKFNSWETAVDGGFVPFAITSRHEPYCWRLDWGTDGNDSPIVLCERSEKAICLAPNFEGFLYRMAIEAFAGRNDINASPKCQDDLLRAVEILAGVLPPVWSARLLDLQAKPWRNDEKSGSMVVLSWAEGEQIIQADLSFPHLNEKFVHDKDYLKRLQNKK